MSRGKQKTYDDEVLAYDIAKGGMTYAEIAAKHGLSNVMVLRIANGDRRPELQDRINLIRQSFLEQAQRLGASLASKAMEQLGDLMGGKQVNEEVRRKAAVDVLKFTIGDPSKTEINVNNTNKQKAGGFSDIKDPKLREAINEYRGGPVSDE